MSIKYGKVSDRHRWSGCWPKPPLLANRHRLYLLGSKVINSEQCEQACCWPNNARAKVSAVGQCLMLMFDVLLSPLYPPICIWLLANNVKVSDRSFDLSLPLLALAPDFRDEKKRKQGTICMSPLSVTRRQRKCWERAKVLFLVKIWRKQVAGKLVLLLDGALCVESWKQF